MIVRFRVATYGADGAFDSDVWFEGEDKRQKAIDAAQAMARPGSLSADDGDKIIVEEHQIHMLATFTKPSGH